MSTSVGDSESGLLMSGRRSTSPLSRLFNYKRKSTLRAIKENNSNFADPVRIPIRLVLIVGTPAYFNYRVGHRFMLTKAAAKSNWTDFKLSKQ
jgi:hypothetical protein